MLFVIYYSLLVTIYLLFFVMCILIRFKFIFTLNLVALIEIFVSQPIWVVVVFDMLCFISWVQLGLAFTYIFSLLHILYLVFIFNISLFWFFVFLGGVVCLFLFGHLLCCLLLIFLLSFVICFLFLIFFIHSLLLFISYHL